MKWSEFKPGTEEGILTLDQMMSIMSTPRHKERLSSRYISSAPGYAAPFLENLKEVTKGSAYWSPAPR